MPRIRDFSEIVRKHHYFLRIINKLREAKKREEKISGHMKMTQVGQRVDLETMGAQTQQSGASQTPVPSERCDWECLGLPQFT